jgi:EAL domain-containing protein (putative c-di-GMP-specific phosphodiesterase class I)
MTTEDVATTTAIEQAMAVEIRGAIERGEFEIHYQPKLHLRSGLMTRAEALVRWHHPDRGLLLPAAFIPAAERTGAIDALTDWILDHVMQQIVEWHAAGAPVHVAVNISPKSLLDQALPAKMQTLLDKWKIDPRFVKIEITEAPVVADPANALGIITMLQSIGLRLALDDFGVGYSSLTYLRQLPVDEIKIDESLITSITTSEADEAMVRAILEIGRQLGRQVCAEGVENAETWRRLRDMGCDLAQGYWISRPLPAAELLVWLVDTSWGMKIVSG